MHKRQKPGKERPAKRRLVCFAWAAIGLSALPTFTGCSSSQKLHSGDPLVGEFYPKGPNGQILPPPQTGNAQNKTPTVPPIPSANAASSNAAIAANTNLPGGRPLAINEQSGPNWTLTNTTKTGNPQTNPPRGPTVQPVPRDTTGPITATNPGGSGILPAANWASTDAKAEQNKTPPPLGTTTVEVLEGTLKAKGAVGLKQETVPEGIRVSCFAPNRTNTSSLRFYETTAPNLLSALQAIALQIDQQR